MFIDEVLPNSSRTVRPRTRPKTRKLFPVDENRPQQRCAAPHEHYCQQCCYLLLGLTMLQHVVDNIVHSVQHNIVEACFHQPGTG